MGKSTLFDGTFKLHHKTVKAILISNDGNPDNAVWIPLLKDEDGEAEVVYEVKKGNTIEVTMPEWLAVEKGFV